MPAILVYAANPIAYGTALSKMLFADEALRRGWYETQGAMRASSQRLRFVIDLDVRDKVLSNIRWELLRDPDDDIFLFANESICSTMILLNSNI